MKLNERCSRTAKIHVGFDSEMQGMKMRKQGRKGWVICMGVESASWLIGKDISRLVDRIS